MTSESAGRQHPLGVMERPPPGGDLLGEVRGVVGDEPEQCRTAGVLPGQAEEVQAWHVGDPAPVHGATVRDGAGDSDPRVVGPVAGGPDHDGGVESAAVGEPCGLSLALDEAGTESDTGVCEPAPVAADDELPACLQPTT